MDVHPLSLHDLDITSSILVIGNMIIYITLMMPGFYSVYVQAKDLVGYRSPVTAAYLIRFGPRQTDPCHPNLPEPTSKGHNPPLHEEFLILLSDKDTSSPSRTSGASVSISSRSHCSKAVAICHATYDRVTARSRSLRRSFSDSLTPAYISSDLPS